MKDFDGEWEETFDEPACDEEKYLAADDLDCDYGDEPYFQEDDDFYTESSDDSYYPDAPDFPDEPYHSDESWIYITS